MIASYLKEKSIPKLKVFPESGMNLENIYSLLRCASGHIWIALRFVWAVLNSNFAIALISGFAGAFAGALGAQRIVERGRHREEMLKELRNTNAAIMVAFSGCNTGLALKKQLVQPMYEKFLREKKKLENFLDRYTAGQIQGNAEYHFVADLQIFTAPEVPVETLKDLIFNKISADGRALACVSELEKSVVNLKSSVLERQHLVQKFAEGSVPGDKVQYYYFGIPLASGHVHREYSDVIESIHCYLNDVVFFSSLLCTDLVSHGNKMHKAFTSKFGKGAPSVNIPDFSGPRAKGLIPPDTEYIDWLNGIIEKHSDKKGGSSKQ